jgi:hypothetical protein
MQLREQRRKAPSPEGVNVSALRRPNLIAPGYPEAGSSFAGFSTSRDLGHCRTTKGVTWRSRVVYRWRLRRRSPRDLQSPASIRDL